MKSAKWSFRHVWHPGMWSMTESWFESLTQVLVNVATSFFNPEISIYLRCNWRRVWLLQCGLEPSPLRRTALILRSSFVKKKRILTKTLNYALHHRIGRKCYCRCEWVTSLGKEMHLHLKSIPTICETKEALFLDTGTRQQSTCSRW